MGNDNEPTAGADTQARINAALQQIGALYAELIGALAAMPSDEQLALTLPPATVQQLEKEIRQCSDQQVIALEESVFWIRRQIEAIRKLKVD